VILLQQLFSVSWPRIPYTDVAMVMGYWCLN
jgi:hypothetical protein